MGLVLKVLTGKPPYWFGYGASGEPELERLLAAQRIKRSNYFAIKTKNDYTTLISWDLEGNEKIFF